jgi:cytochrome c
MKILTIAIIGMMACGLLFTAAFAVHEGDVGSAALLSGNIEKGMTLFNDTKFAGATSGKSCNSCHPDGKGLEKAEDKKEFNIMGKKQSSLEEAVNFCIEMAIKGKAIDTKSDQMMDIVAYIKSLKGKMIEKEMPMKGKKQPPGY